MELHASVQATVTQVQHCVLALQASSETQQFSSRQSLQLSGTKRSHASALLLDAVEWDVEETPLLEELGGDEEPLEQLQLPNSEPVALQDRVPLAPSAHWQARVSPGAQKVPVQEHAAYPVPAALQLWFPARASAHVHARDSPAVQGSSPHSQVDVPLLQLVSPSSPLGQEQALP